MESRLGIPLPKVVADVGPGGGIPSAVNALNEIQKQTIANRLAPLEQMIKAQNALAYTSKTGNIGTYLRALSQMPVAERQAYLADKTNRANYMAMLEQFRTGVNQPGGGNVLTPQYIQSVMGGGGGMGGGNDIFSYLGNKIFGGGQQNAMAQAPQQNMQANPMGQLNQGYQSEQEEPLPIPGQPSQAAPEETQAPVELPQTTSAQEGKSDIDKIPSYNDVFKASEKISPEQRGALAAQLIDNNQRIGTKLKNRADAAIAFDAFMISHRKEIAKVMADYAKYSRYYGRVKNWMDKLRIDQPEEYANLITAKESIIPLISNGIRYLEGMGESHQAQEHARQQSNASMGELDVSPETAIKVFNNHIRALRAVSNGVLTSAEPAHPGVRRKLAGLPEFPDEYIPIEKKGKGNNQAPGTVKMRGIDPKDKKMKTWVVPEDQASVYETEGGFKRVGK